MAFKGGQSLDATSHRDTVLSQFGARRRRTGRWCSPLSWRMRAPQSRAASKTREGGTVGEPGAGGGGGSEAALTGLQPAPRRRSWETGATPNARNSGSIACQRDCIGDWGPSKYAWPLRAASPSTRGAIATQFSPNSGQGGAAREGGVVHSHGACELRREGPRARRGREGPWVSRVQGGAGTARQHSLDCCRPPGAA